MEHPEWDMDELKTYMQWEMTPQDKEKPK